MLEKLRERRSQGESGFTLIELLIVIIILGILAAIVVFAIGNTRKDSVTNSCKTDAKAIQLSLEAQKTTGGSYPQAAAAGVNPAGAVSNGSNPAGALLKVWPGGTNAATDDYIFTYGVNNVANGAIPAGQYYSVTISGKSVTGGGGFTDLTDGVAAACAGK